MEILFAPMMPQMATRDAPAARAPARYASETVPPGFGYSKDGIVSRVFGSAARRVDKCWPPFLLLAQSVARDYLDQDVQTLVAAVEQALEGAEGEGVDVAPPAFDVFDDAESVLRGHVLRLGTALKEVAGSRVASSSSASVPARDRRRARRRARRRRHRAPRSDAVARVLRIPQTKISCRCNCSGRSISCSSCS